MSNKLNNEILPLNVIMDGMVAKFNPANAIDKHIIYKFIFDGYDPIYLEIKDNTAKLLSSEPSHVDTTITTTHETWYKIAFNKLSGQDALMEGLVSCSGNLRNFASMPKIFDKEIPDNFSSNESNTSNSNDNNISENNTKEIENTSTRELMPIKAIMNGMLSGFDSSKAEGLDISISSMDILLDYTQYFFTFNSFCIFNIIHNILYQLYKTKKFQKHN